MYLKIEICFLYWNIFLTFILLSVSKGLIYESNNDCTNILSKIVKSFKSHFFPLGSLLHIIVSEDNAVCLTLFFIEDLFYEWQVIISCPDNSNQDKNVLAIPPDIYIILLEDCQTPDPNQLYNITMVQQQLYSHSWNPGAKFLVIKITSLVFSDQTRNNLLIDTFNFMWKTNIFRVVMVISENNGGNVTAFSSTPYSNYYKTCKKITTSGQIYKTNLMDSNMSTKFVISWFFFETPKNYFGCPLIGYTEHFPPYSIAADNKRVRFNTTYNAGTEIELVHLFVNIYNFSLKLFTRDYIAYSGLNGWSHKFANGSSVGMLYDILNYKIDLAFAGALPHHKYFLSGQVFTNIFSSISWYVPSPGFISPWEIVANIFTPFTWLVLVVQFLLFTLMYYLMEGFIPRSDQNVKNREPVFLLMLRAMLGNSIVCSPKLNHMRIMLIAWYLFSLHMTSMYNSQLFSVLTERPVYPPIMTIKELYESGLKTCTPKLYRDFYKNRTDSYIRMVLENALICNDMEVAVDDFRNKKDFSILGKDDYMGFLVKRNEVNIYKLFQKFFTYPVPLLVTKGSILIKPLSRLIEKVTESGLMQKWRHDIRNEVEIKYATRSRNSLRHIALTKNDFVWLYILLLGGHGVAFIVFTIELCYSKYNNSAIK